MDSQTKRKTWPWQLHASSSSRSLWKWCNRSAGCEISRPHSTQLHGAANIAWTGLWWLENRGSARTTNSPRFAPQAPTAETEVPAPLPETVATATPHCSHVFQDDCWRHLDASHGASCLFGASGVVRRIGALQTVAGQTTVQARPQGAQKKYNLGVTQPSKGGVLTVRVAYNASDPRAECRTAEKGSACVMEVVCPMTPVLVSDAM